MHVGRAALVLAGAAALVAFQSIFHVVSLFPALALGAWWALAIVRPHDALLLLAAIVPVARVIGVLTGQAILTPEVFVLGFLSAWLLRAAVAGPAPPRGLSIPAAVFAAIVAGSCLVELAVLERRLGDAFWPAFRAFAWRGYFSDRIAFRPVQDAALLIEGAGLALAAAAIGRERAGLAPRLVHALVAGAAAAAALNVNRFVEVLLTRPGQSALTFLSSLRVNTAYGDVNAAGSYFAAAVLLALALAVDPHARHRNRAAWAAAAVVIVLALWLTGSRTAAAAGLVAAVVTWLGAAVVRRRMPAARLLAAAVVVLLAAVGASRVFHARQNQRAVGVAMEVRTELARTSARMLATRPLFGVGIGLFQQQSTSFSSARLLEIFPPARIGENAHNNFLQVAAELGVLGLVAFLWVLWAALGPSAALLRAAPPNVPAAGVAAALGAFLLTCLAGHPLLVEEPAYTFWILLGVPMSLAPAVVAPARRDRAVRAAAIVLVALTAASVPLRARRERGSADLEHVALGASGWHQADDGTSFRWTGDRSAIFIPADADVVTIPLRPAPGATGEVEVELRLDGRTADRVRLRTDDWTRVRLIMPPPGDGPRFRRLDLIVQGAAATGPWKLMVGKALERSVQRGRG